MDYFKLKKKGCFLRHSFGMLTNQFKMGFYLVCSFKNSFQKVVGIVLTLTKKEEKNSLHRIPVAASLDVSKDGYIFCRSITTAGIIQNYLHFKLYNQIKFEKK